MGDNGYALDMLSPVRHVATELDRAAPAALSVEAMAATYTHPNPGDLARVRRHERRASDSAAVTWLIGRAVAALGEQVTSDGNDGYELTRTFDKIRYDRKKLVRTAAEDEDDEQRTLRALYNDLAEDLANEDRAFYVTVRGQQGGTKDMRFRLHSLAYAIPPIEEEEFFKLATDIKARGVRNPITIFNGRVLDGRHRLALASALKLPLRTVTFEGDETAARDEVVSQNLQRRHLTIPQRALIVQELYLPEAEAKAKERQGARTDLTPTSAPSGAEVKPDVRAIEDAVKQSNGLATVRTMQRMAPVRDAPRTRERIRSGEIKNAAQARREALKETGSDEPEDVGVLQPRSASRYLSTAVAAVRDACEALERGDLGQEHRTGLQQGKVTSQTILGRIAEIRAQLDRAEGMLG